MCALTVTSDHRPQKARTTMYDFRMQINDPLPSYRLRLPSEERRQRRPHPGQRPSQPLDLGCVRPSSGSHPAPRGR